MVIATSANNSDSSVNDKKAYCEGLAKTITSISELPAACKNFESVQELLQKRKTVHDPFEGMPSGSAAKARADRSLGREHHAQIQRRLTTGATTGTRRFSKLDK